MDELSKDFKCCLEYAGKGVPDITTIPQFHEFYNTTKHCQAYLNESMKAYAMNYIIRHALFSEFKPEECVNYCHEPTQGWFNVYVAFWIIALIIGMLSNTVVLATFFKSAILRTSVTNYFVTSLAAADILVIVFGIPIRINKALHNSYFCSSVEICQLFYTSDVTFFVASITNVFVITVDRLLAITRPYDYKHILTHLRAKCIIIFVLVYAVTWGVMVNYNEDTNSLDAVTVSNGRCLIENATFYIIVFAVVFFVPSLIMLVIYALILSIALGHAKSIDNRHAAIKSERRPSIFTQVAFFQNRKLELRATKVVLVVYGTFLVCWLPTICIAFLQNVHNTTIGNHPILEAIFGEVLPILNSIMNPFIYGILHRDFKHGIKRMFGVLYLKHQMRSSTNRKYNLDLSLSHCRTTRSVCYSPKSPFGHEGAPFKGRHYLDITHDSTLSHEDFFNVDTTKLLSKGGDIPLSPLAAESPSVENVDEKFPNQTLLPNPTGCRLRSGSEPSSLSNQKHIELRHRSKSTSDKIQTSSFPSSCNPNIEISLKKDTDCNKNVIDNKISTSPLLQHDTSFENIPLVEINGVINGSDKLQSIVPKETIGLKLCDVENHEQSCEDEEKRLLNSS